MRLSLFLLTLVLAGCSSVRSGAPAPSFQLTSQLGQSTGLADLRGRPVLLTFVYTHCPDTCPLYLANIATALRSVPGTGAESPAVVVVTVDPDRDTVERLQEYASLWPSDWLFLTGTYQQLARVWQSYGITIEKRPGEHSSEVHHGYSVVHNAKIVLIDGTGLARGELVGTWASAELVAALNAPPGQAGVVAGLSPLAAAGELLRRCGELATAQPAVFLGLLAVLMLPGVLLPVYLLRALLRAP